MTSPSDFVIKRIFSIIFIVVDAENLMQSN